MITRYCDICGAEIDGSAASNRIKVKKDRVEVEVMVAVDSVWNGGDVCRSCVIDVLTPAGGWIGREACEYDDCTMRSFRHRHRADGSAEPAVLDVADSAPASATLVDALRLIDRHGCETFTRGRCLDANSGRRRGAPYGAEAWCDPCVARAALDAAAPTPSDRAAYDPAMGGDIFPPEGRGLRHPLSSLDMRGCQVGDRPGFDVIHRPCQTVLGAFTSCGAFWCYGDTLDAAVSPDAPHALAKDDVLTIVLANHLCPTLDRSTT